MSWVKPRGTRLGIRQVRLPKVQVLTPYTARATPLHFHALRLDVHVSTVLPDLRGLLTVPAPAPRIVFQKTSHGQHDNLMTIPGSVVSGSKSHGNFATRDQF